MFKRFGPTLSLCILVWHGSVFGQQQTEIDLQTLPTEFAKALETSNIIANDPDFQLLKGKWKVTSIESDDAILPAQFGQAVDDVITIMVNQFSQPIFS